jgi:hypothetical protein
MGTLTIRDGDYEYLWESDVDYDSMRLEVNDLEGQFWFDVSLSNAGTMTVNTFSREVPADLIMAAVALAKSDSNVCFPSKAAGLLTPIADIGTRTGAGDGSRVLQEAAP